VFFCQFCAGGHRNLGVNVSFVLSPTLDDWTTEQAKGMYGNTPENPKYKEFIPFIPKTPITEDISLDNRYAWIRAKYLKHEFVPKKDDEHNSKKKN